MKLLKLRISRSRKRKFNIYITSYKAICLIGFTLLISEICNAQSLHGIVSEWDEGMKMEMPLPGANVYWLESNEAVQTDQNGKFEISLPGKLPAKLVVSFVGYHSDTIDINDSNLKKIRLQKSVELKTVEVKAKQESMQVSTMNPINTEKLNQKELLKAACCNLSEAFETSPTVNVSYKDAVTGAKEIQLLGLAGIYSQLLTENIPNMRGIAGIYALNYIPGPWMESIQVTKGTGSVLNGYESTTGQLNIEFKKPDSDETPKFYLNLFGESNTNAEINVFRKQKVNEKMSTILMLHGNYMNKNIDDNHDSFLDAPKNRQFNLYNRWQFHNSKKIESQFGVRFLTDHREGGQMPSTVNQGNSTELYTTKVDNNRVELFGKLGFIYPENPRKSIGNIIQFTYHDMNSAFGLKSYDATEKTFYFQSIYQNVFPKPEHQYRFGVSYLYNFLDQSYNAAPSTMEESVPGIFAEYTYNHIDKLVLVGGFREDYHSNVGWVGTPRFHGKYNFTENFLVRMSAGKSFRVPYLYADNLSVMASSKELVIEESIRPERAWNYGINLTRKFIIHGKENSISADFYRTDFIDQLIVDSYSDSSKISFYNLDGSSYSNSFQVMLTSEVLERVEVRLAYKRDDVKSTYAGKLEQKPLVAREKGLFHVAYSTANEHWKFNYTFIVEGRKKLATTFHDPEIEEHNDYSPVFSIMNFQATKAFRKFEVYAGCENILDYKQEHPIINPLDPFSNSFDASNVWGPIEGRRIYAGLRYSIN